MTNTTALIDHWNMEGAATGLEYRFESAVDIMAIVSELPAPSEVEPTAADDLAPAAVDRLLVKRADEDDWQPLVDG